MKILNVVYSLGKGGTERAAQNFALGYSEIGHDSRLLYTREDGVRRRDLENKGISLFYLGSQKDCEIIRAWCPDVIHLHSHGITVDEFEKLKGLVPSAKYVETNVFSTPSPWAASIDISYQLSHWCLWLFRKRSRNKYMSTIVPYPVDTSSFERTTNQVRNEFREKYGIKESDILIGRVGQRFDGKWSPVLIEVFESIRKGNSNIKLIVVNPPDSILLAISNSPFKSDIIHIREIIGDASLAVCYSSIDIFVLIADQGESFGMVLAEALLCETPVVTLASPWADNTQGEVVGNGIGGYVASNKDSLSFLVKRLIVDQAVRRKMGIEGRRRVMQLYDYKAVAKKSTEIIKSGFLNFDVSRPSMLMSDSEGHVNLISRVILRSENLFFLLTYSLGYRPLYRIPIGVLRRLAKVLLGSVGVR